MQGPLSESFFWKIELGDLAFCNFRFLPQKENLKWAFGVFGTVFSFLSIEIRIFFPSKKWLFFFWKESFLQREVPNPWRVFGVQKNKNKTLRGFFARFKKKCFFFEFSEWRQNKKSKWFRTENVNVCWCHNNLNSILVF